MILYSRLEAVPPDASASIGSSKKTGVVQDLESVLINFIASEASRKDKDMALRERELALKEAMFRHSVGVGSNIASIGSNTSLEK